MADTVLVESTTTIRDSLVNVHGSSDNIAMFMNLFQNETYKNEDVTRVTLPPIIRSNRKNIVVHGFDPIIQDVPNPSRIQEWIPICAVLVQKWGYGFYHFLNEILPKILRIYEYNNKLPILIHYNNTFIKSVIEYIGITNPIIQYQPNIVYPIKNAIIVTETPSGNPSQSDIALIRKHMRIRDDETISAPVNILIYRKEARRNIVNFNDLKSALEARITDAPWVVFESLPFASCVELFKRAKRIVAPHGAGLSNMMFAPAGTPIYELFPRNLVNLCYWHLAWILNNPHHSIVCNSTNNSALDILVDIDLVCNTIQTTRV